MIDHRSPCGHQPYFEMSRRSRPPLSLACNRPRGHSGVHAMYQAASSQVLAAWDERGREVPSARLFVL